MVDEFRLTLLQIGSQHPAWSSNPDDKLVSLFNQVTRLARETVGAVGDDDDDRADWCTSELERISA